MTISVYLKPGSKEQTLSFIKEGVYKVNVKSPAKENKANLELIALLSEFFQTPKNQIVIKGGFKSRIKVVSIGSV